ncbi:hypothetical protein PENTCL1PPCAC_1513 [Pristionchus entomophagus]|uniref:Ribosomal protein n=1 Tax=Pristionchus entomophagus TaxID=358040 RepID=A0AAV5S978_9BILA|nr:hypothetical protein PENTCL1PPCAC_1513 [Pristionchus entomophagus]
MRYLHGPLLICRPANTVEWIGHPNIWLIRKRNYQEDRKRRVASFPCFVVGSWKRRLRRECRYRRFSEH